jgi:hypothetical protein
MSRLTLVIVRPGDGRRREHRPVSQNTFSAPLTDFRPKEPVSPEVSSRRPGRFFSRLPVVM